MNDEGPQEGGGFATSGLGDADQVSPAESCWDGLSLDGRGLKVKEINFLSA